MSLFDKVRHFQRKTIKRPSPQQLNPHVGRKIHVQVDVTMESYIYIYIHIGNEFEVYT